MNTVMPRRQLGMSLIELMISVAIGLVILSAVLYLYSGNRQVFRTQEQAARMLDSGRFALEIVGRSIREAGFADLSSAQSSFKVATSSVAPINGTNGGGSASDVLTLQRDGALNDRGCLGTRIVATGNVIQESFNRNAATNELRCDEQIAPAPGAAATGTAIISDVEDFQVLYGVDTDADQSANLYTATPAAWGNVVSVRACLQLRSAEIGVVTGNQTFLNCTGALAGSGAVTTSTDRRLHKVYVATYNLRNRVNQVP